MASPILVQHPPFPSVYPTIKPYGQYPIETSSVPAVNQTDKYSVLSKTDSKKCSLTSKQKKNLVIALIIAAGVVLILGSAALLMTKTISVVGKVIFCSLPSSSVALASIALLILGAYTTKKGAKVLAHFRQGIQFYNPVSANK